ncbi:MAG: sugar kinase [Betaproteobacteria bacterium]
MAALKFDVVALGEPMVEFNQVRPDDPTLYRQGFGGDTSNCIIAAARLGARTAYVTRLGDDAFGRMFSELWRREGVDARGVGIDTSAPTGIYFVTHGLNGHEFSYRRAGSAAARMQPGDLPLDVIRAGKVLHISGISQAISDSARTSVSAAIAVARAAGVRISYDSNLRLKLWPLEQAKAVIIETVARCDWFVPSLEEVQLLSGEREPAAIVEWAHALGAPVVVLKMGADGCWVSSTGVREHIPGNHVDACDATGAGDCFDGAFAARIVAGDSPLDAARYANAAAALATTGFGAVAPLPRHEDVVAFLGRAR